MALLTFNQIQLHSFDLILSDYALFLDGRADEINVQRACDPASSTSPPRLIADAEPTDGAQDVIELPRTPLRILHGLPHSLADVATRFFVVNLATQPAPSPHYTSYIHVCKDMIPEVSQSSAFYHAMMAMGTGTMAKYSRMRSVNQNSYLMYGRALRLVAEDIKDPVRSKSDETLLAVMMLSVYEVGGCRLAV